MSGLTSLEGIALELCLSLGAGTETSIPALKRRPREEQARRAREKLLETLLNLNVSQFEACVAKLLEALSFRDVRVMRCHRLPRLSHKGRNRHGGFDLSARASAFSPPLVLVQAKQYQRAVSRRFVDELRGAIIRQSAQQGLLITTSRFAPNARLAAEENPLLPIALIDGESLVELLFRHQIGVVLQECNGRLYWRLDLRFFRELCVARNSC